MATARLDFPPMFVVRVRLKCPSCLGVCDQDLPLPRLECGERSTIYSSLQDSIEKQNAVNFGTLMVSDVKLIQRADGQGKLLSNLRDSMMQPARLYQNEKWYYQRKERYFAEAKCAACRNSALLDTARMESNVELGSLSLGPLYTISTTSLVDDEGLGTSSETSDISRDPTRILEVVSQDDDSKGYQFGGLTLHDPRSWNPTPYPDVLDANRPPEDDDPYITASDSKIEKTPTCPSEDISNTPTITSSSKKSSRRSDPPAIPNSPPPKPPRSLKPDLPLKQCPKIHDHQICTSDTKQSQKLDKKLKEHPGSYVLLRAKGALILRTGLIIMKRNKLSSKEKEKVDGLRYFVINCEGGPNGQYRYFLSREQYFDTVYQLILFYAVHPIRISNVTYNTRLHRPL